jgi:hypothetical protein
LKPRRPTPNKLGFPLVSPAVNSEEHGACALLALGDLGLDLIQDI